MTRIVGLPGSLRRASFNHGLLRAAADLMPPGATLDIRTLEGIPLYNADDEAASGLPPAVVALKEAISHADGVLIATPEYNNGIPGVFKNAIDWASRPTDGEAMLALSAYRGKAAAIMSASISPFGGLRGLMHLRQILSTIQMLVIPEQVLVPNAHAAFAEDGSLKEPLPASLVEMTATRLVAVAKALSA